MPGWSPVRTFGGYGAWGDKAAAVQPRVLREAASSPQILRRSTAQALLALGEAGVLTPLACRELGDAAALFRDVHAVLFVE